MCVVFFVDFFFFLVFGSCCFLQLINILRGIIYNVYDFISVNID